MLGNGVARMNRIVAQKGRGCWLQSTNGTRYLDMTSGIGALSTGHSHPRIIEAVQRQVTQLAHAQQNCVLTHPAQQQLLRSLSATLPTGLDHFFFTNSGSEGVENALKLARLYTRRPNIVTCIGGFHGRTLGCMSVSSAKVSSRKGCQPLLPGIFQLEYPTDLSKFRDQLATLFARQSSPEETAAILVEPILGEGGVLQANRDAMQHLREECTRHDILWISDEVQTGMGRTGQWWGYEHFGDIAPDVLVFGKGISSGYPLAGIVGNRKHFASIHSNGLGGTYNGNCIATAAACATLEVFHREELVPRAQLMGRQLRDLIRDMAHARVREVRQYGLMLAVELELPRHVSMEDALARAPDHGLLLLGTGVRPSVRLLPPLTITHEDLACFRERFEQWLDALST